MAPLAVRFVTMSTHRILRSALAAALLAAPAAALAAQPEPGESPALPRPRVKQQKIENGSMTLDEVRRAGLVVFSTAFNRFDGYGDGPLDPADTTSPGGRPSLQGNGMLLRVNGLDGQSCLECHSIVSAASTPPVFGIGGVGGAVSNAMFMTRAIDVEDAGQNGFAAFDGRFINPPFVFGAGAIELLAAEMTRDLQALRQAAVASPGIVVPLVTKGVDFGTIVADGIGNVDTSGVAGVDPDLVVRPFGRKGEFATTRAFDVDALRFHFGMEPVEAVGEGLDGDGDGVVDEILEGELSALSAFLTSLEAPRQDPRNGRARRGEGLFGQIGCAECHVPQLTTNATELGLRFPEVETDPDANVFMKVDLSDPRIGLAPSGAGGVVVPLFADLKRHDMGPGLAESFAGADATRNREFTTARLWGVADTAPYLHDGRATTLTDAILAHGGEAQAARDAFEALPAGDRKAILSFLRSLRTPESPVVDLLKGSTGAD